MTNRKTYTAYNYSNCCIENERSFKATAVVHPVRMVISRQRCKAETYKDH